MHGPDDEDDVRAKSGIAPEDYAVSEADIQRARAAAAKQKQTNEAMGGYVNANKLDPAMLKQILDKYAPGNEAAEDGVYAQSWMATDTFYRFTEEYVAPEKRHAYKAMLEGMFPGKKQGR